MNRRTLMLGYACAARRQRGELVSLALDLRELVRELIYLRGEYRRLRGELERLKRIEGGAEASERPEGVALH